MIRVLFAHDGQVVHGEGFVKINRCETSGVIDDVITFASFYAWTIRHDLRRIPG